MSELTLPARIALVGNPNSGKTALFNALTGSRQKVANYPGVTVERKEGLAVTPAGLIVRLIDLPGTYSLRARSLDEVVTRDIVLGRLEGEDVNLSDVTASIGVATFPDHASDADSLFRAADAAMYSVKRAGKNRVAISAAKEH